MTMSAEDILLTTAVTYIASWQALSCKELIRVIPCQHSRCRVKLINLASPANAVVIKTLNSRSVRIHFFKFNEESFAVLHTAATKSSNQKIANLQTSKELTSFCSCAIRESCRFEWSLNKWFDDLYTITHTNKHAYKHLYNFKMCFCEKKPCQFSQVLVFWSFVYIVFVFQETNTAELLFFFFKLMGSCITDWLDRCSIKITSMTAKSELFLKLQLNDFSYF